MNEPKPPIIRYGPVPKRVPDLPAIPQPKARVLDLVIMIIIGLGLIMFFARP